jgi:hypothetical protein
MNAESSASLRFLFVRFGATLSGLVLLYFLGSGPVIYNEYVGANSSLVLTVYRPVFSMAREDWAKPLRIYIDWWKVMALKRMRVDDSEPII